MHRPGIQCVVVQVWHHPNWTVPRLGDVLVVGTHIAQHEEMVAAVLGMPHPGCVWQEVAIGMRAAHYPVDWMRPLDKDVDAEDIAIADMYRAAAKLTRKQLESITEKHRG